MLRSNPCEIRVHLTSDWSARWPDRLPRRTVPDNPRHRHRATGGHSCHPAVARGRCNLHTAEGRAGHPVGRADVIPGTLSPPEDVNAGILCFFQNTLVEPQPRKFAVGIAMIGIFHISLFFFRQKVQTLACANVFIVRRRCKFKNQKVVRNL